MFLLVLKQEGHQQQSASPHPRLHSKKTAYRGSFPHRIREAMRSVGLGPMGGAGMTVEVDENLHWSS
jgi:hypothetical protein